MIFGGGKRIAALEADNAKLQQELNELKGLDAVQREQRLEVCRKDLETVTHAVADARAKLDALKAEADTVKTQIVETREIALLQEVGIYEYRHPLEDAVAYKSRLANNKDKIKALARGDRAVTSITNWTVNNSRKEGAKMVREFSKLMLRAYNAEADNAVRTLRPYALDSALTRLGKARETIARLGQTMQIRISDEYHRARLYELELTADYLVKVEEERERLREERARQREEEKARREFEAEKARLGKEQSHYLTALAKLQAKGDAEAIAQLETKLAEIAAAIKGVEEREANIRAGYVYVISNFGSFGEHVVKIGMTRRLEPMDRVRELGDASVPFRYDVHALVFSDDAVGLEGRLHAEFAERRVNVVNPRREFFYCTPIEVRDLLARVDSQHLLEFHDVPEAEEWRASGGPERRAAQAAEAVTPGV